MRVSAHEEPGAMNERKNVEQTTFAVQLWYLVLGVLQVFLQGGHLVGLLRHLILPLDVPAYQRDLQQQHC